MRATRLPYQLNRFATCVIQTKLTIVHRDLVWEASKKRTIIIPGKGGRLTGNLISKTASVKATALENDRGHAAQERRISIRPRPLASLPLDTAGPLSAAPVSSGLTLRFIRFGFLADQDVSKKPVGLPPCGENIIRRGVAYYVFDRG